MKKLTVLLLVIIGVMNMELSDVWVKIAKNEQLTPMELDFLKIQGKETQKSNSKVSEIFAPDGVVALNRPYITSPKWRESPLGVYSFQRIADVSISDGTDTFITFDTFFRPSTYFNVDPLDNSKIIVNNPENVFQISGTIQFEDNPTGYRNVKLWGYTSSGTLLGSITLNAVSAINGGVTLVVVSQVMDLSAVADLRYFKISVGQTSGSTIALQYLQFAVYIV